MTRGVPKNGYPKNRKSRPMTSELRAAISEGNKRAWQDPEHQARQHAGHLGVRPGGVAATGQCITEQGYRLLTGQWSHPLVDPAGGGLLEHRKVLYDTIGQGPHDCHWCGVTLEWGGLEGIIADHLDFDRLNNDPENLVPSCNPCNWRRVA